MKGAYSSEISVLFAHGQMVICLKQENIRCATFVEGQAPAGGIKYQCFNWASSERGFVSISLNTYLPKAAILQLLLDCKAVL